MTKEEFENLTKEDLAALKKKLPKPFGEALKDRSGCGSTNMVYDVLNGYYYNESIVVEAIKLAEENVSRSYKKRFKKLIKAS